MLHHTLLAVAIAIENEPRPVIVAGFGRLGNDLGRMLIAAGIKPVILDSNEANVDTY